MTSNNIAFSIFPSTTNTLPETGSNHASTAPSLELLSSYTVQGVGLEPLSGIPVLLPDHSGFKETIATWSLHHQPTERTGECTHAVLSPQTSGDIVRIVDWARKGGIKIVSRSGGAGGASGRGGVCLDLRGFNRVELDEESQVCTIGPGQTWADVNAKLRGTGYSVLGSRTPFIGVGGYLLYGGLSWLSHEYGIANDPKNLVGATIVLADGRVINANNDETATPEERDLIWAIRGGGGNFGAVTEFRLRAVPTPKKIFAGYVFYSFDQFPTLSPLLANHLVTNPLPTSCMIMMIMDFGRALGSTEFVPMIGISIYDALGEAHARTKSSADGGFVWLWDVPGGPKAERISEGTYEEAVNTQAASGALFGLTSCHMDTFTPWHGEVDVEFLERCVQWYKTTTETVPEIAPSTFILVEPMHPECFDHGVRDEDTAWPHSKGRDVIQLGCAWMGDRGDEEHAEMMDEKCKDAIRRACAEIPTSKRPSYPNYGDAANDNTIDDVYGANVDRLRMLKAKYDPEGVFLSAGLRIPAREPHSNPDMLSKFP